MRTIRTKVYKFSELSKPAQQKAIEKMYDINVDYEWWESTYEDAANVGLKITGFDIDRGSYCKAEFIEHSENVAAAIIENHGETCQTYKTAQSFIASMKVIEDRARAEGKDGDESYWFDTEIEDAEDEFLKSLCEDYLKILRDEYEYLTSEDAIIETIEANEYEFTKDGNRF